MAFLRWRRKKCLIDAARLILAHMPDSATDAVSQLAYFHTCPPYQKFILKLLNTIFLLTKFMVKVA